MTEVSIFIKTVNLRYPVTGLGSAFLYRLYTLWLGAFGFLLILCGFYIVDVLGLLVSEIPDVVSSCTLPPLSVYQLNTQEEPLSFQTLLVPAGTPLIIQAVCAMGKKTKPRGVKPWNSIEWEKYHVGLRSVQSVCNEFSMGRFNL